MFANSSKSLLRKAVLGYNGLIIQHISMTQGIGINASGHNEQNDVVPNLHGSNFGYFMATINGYFCDHSFEGKVFMIKEYLQSKLSKRQYELMRMLSFEYNDGNAASQLLLVLKLNWTNCIWAVATVI